MSEAASPEQVLAQALQQVSEAEAQVAGVTVAVSRVREPEQAQPSYAAKQPQSLLNQLVSFPCKGPLPVTARGRELALVQLREPVKAFAASRAGPINQC